MNTHSIKSPSQPANAFAVGYDAYPFCHTAGHRAARLWLSSEPSETLARFRDIRWKAFTYLVNRTKAEHQAFNDGFAQALAEHIAGVN